MVQIKCSTCKACDGCGNLKGYNGKVIAFLIQSDFFMNI